MRGAASFAAPFFLFKFKIIHIAVDFT